MYKQRKSVKVISFVMCLIVLLSAMMSFSAISYADDSSETVLNSTVIVSMGDSFSAGEGIPKFYDQDEWITEKVHSQDWLAHRSQKSWPGRLTLPAVTNGENRVPMSERRDTNWFFVASSGATTEHIKNSQKKPYDYAGQSFAGNIDGIEYINPQIRVFDELGDKKVDYVTLTIGGNDVGFVDVITTAAMPHPFAPNALRDKIEDIWKAYYDGIDDDIKQAYIDIYERAKRNNPRVKIIVAGYPELMGDKGSGFLFSEKDASIINEAVRKFNKELETIINSCKDEGMRICFVPVADAFDTYEAYAKDDASEEFINRVMPLQIQDIDQSPKIPISAYSIHPNDKGAQAYAECVQKKINQIEADGGKSEWPLLYSSDERDAVLVLDASGSMSGTPMAETKKAAERFVETILYEEAAIGIVAYDDSSVMLSDFNKSEKILKNAIANIYSGGGTNIESGLLQAEKLLDESSAKKKFVVLMSDGQPNTGKTGDELVEYATQLKEKGLRIYTLGFFSEVADKTTPQTLMERIASEGCHFEVDDAEQLMFFFEDIAEQIRGTRYIYIRIACPVDVSVSYGGETLDSKDAEKTQRTEFGTLTFEENPEPSEEGNDNRIKILRLKEGVRYDIDIAGNGKGKMDYTIGFMDENGEYSDMRKFSNIKITKKTEIETIAANEKSTSLKVDEDGDGKYDYVYKAGKNGKAKIVNYTKPVLWMLSPVFALILAIAAWIVVSKIMNKKKED